MCVHVRVGRGGGGGGGGCVHTRTAPLVHMAFGVWHLVYGILLEVWTVWAAATVLTAVSWATRYQLLLTLLLTLLYNSTQRAVLFDIFRTSAGLTHSSGC